MWMAFGSKPFFFFSMDRTSVSGSTN